MEEITQKKESEKEEIKKQIINFAISDWANEFVKILNILDLAEYNKRIDILFSDGEKYNIKLFWERYPDFDKDFVLEMEKEYLELKEMREAIEESQKIMEEVYDFTEKNKNQESEEFWKEINIFLEKAKTQWEKFKTNKDKLMRRPTA